MSASRTSLALLLTALGAAGAMAAGLTPVPAANPKNPGSMPGFAAPNVLSPELELRLVATGSMKLDGATATTSYYGYINSTFTDNNVTSSYSAMVPVLGSRTAPQTPTGEATKSEPDKNTYLVFDPQRGQPQQVGADPAYNYGTHFLYQGHEVGDHGYITRINLDADGAHRVTLLADTLSDGVSLIPNIDGSTWNPYAQRLLLTGEEAAPSGVLEGTVLQATPNYPAQVEKLDTVFGIAGWEGVQVDSAGNVWLVADQGGPNGAVNTKARQPNSFVYRFIPTNRNDLRQGGRLQALQVMNLAGAAPITFTPPAIPGDKASIAAAADLDILSQNVQDLHTYGNRFRTNWVTVHDTAKDGFVAFDANAAAKSVSATPFKRPENGVFRPAIGLRFSEFYFTETGDTNNLSQAGAAHGAYGAVFRLQQQGPNAASGVLSMLYLGDTAHSGFDNIQFLTDRQLLVVEDAGDTMHTQRNALDSGYLFDVTQDYSSGALQPLRFLAEGRDASAALDSVTSGLNQNGDNEITGIHVSDGDPTVYGLLGNKAPRPFAEGWRVFWTQQHGDNNTWEIVPTRRTD
jgi:hypothetical protein